MQSVSQLRRVLIQIAWIAGTLSVLVLSEFIYNQISATTNDPWKSPRLIRLKEDLVTRPKDESLKREIRTLDLEFREKYQRRLSLNRNGAWLLLGGVVVVALCARRIAKFQENLPMPTSPRITAAEKLQRGVRLALRSVAVVGVVISSALFAVSILTGSMLSDTRQHAMHASDGQHDSNTPFSILDSQLSTSFWPSFRGPHGNGFSKMGPAVQANVLWKSSIPSPGNGSPVIWNDRIFISGATAEKREVFCFDAETGNLKWQKCVSNSQDHPKIPEVLPDTGYASSSMATDGRHAYAIFATGDLVAFQFDGTRRWIKQLGVPKNQYGFASSLAVWQGNVIVQFDQGDNAKSGSKLLMFDGADGRLLWERSRPVPASWASPIVIEAAMKAQIIALGVPWVIGYVVKDGTELWRADLLDGEVTPSPASAGDLVIVVSPSNKILAIKSDGAGEVGKTHVAWKYEENAPDVTSPASNGELVFTTTSDGLLMCLDARTGKKLWEHAFEIRVQSSPSIAGDRLVVVGTDGLVVTAAVDREFKELGRLTLQDKFVASPAFAGAHMFLRGETNLFCLGTTGH